MEQCAVRALQPGASFLQLKIWRRTAWQQPHNVPYCQHTQQEPGSPRSCERRTVQKLRDNPVEDNTVKDNPVEKGQSSKQTEAHSPHLPKARRHSLRARADSGAGGGRECPDLAETRLVNTGLLSRKELEKKDILLEPLNMETFETQKGQK